MSRSIDHLSTFRLQISRSHSVDRIHVGLIALAARVLIAATPCSKDRAERGSGRLATRPKHLHTSDDPYLEKASNAVEDTSLGRHCGRGLEAKRKWNSVSAAAKVGCLPLDAWFRGDDGAERAPSRHVRRGRKSRKSYLERPTCFYQV